MPLLPNKLVPKHLNVERNRVSSLRKLKYEEPIADKIRREKKRFMRPLSDIELIMKKFDE